MSDAQNRTPSPGWYPEPSGGPLQRYWDGTGWTDRTYDPISAASAPRVYATVGPEVKVSTPWIWVLVALPLLSLIVVLFVDYRQYFADSLVVQTDPAALGTLPESFGTQLALGALGWGTYLVSVLLAYFDWRALTRRGVQSPFHWAWTFLGGIVYLIGRTVVLRRRGRSAFAPMWVYLGLTLLGIIVSVVKAVDALSVVLDQLPTYG